MRRSSLARSLSGLSSLLLLAGCGAALSHTTAASSTPAVTLTGHVHGGEQPVSGALIQLYTVGTTADASDATPLLTDTVTSDANGNFSFTGLYACTAATQVYLLATGGNPGLNAANPNLALMTALGPCTSLTPQTFISVNELTTVAAVYALQPFMADPTHIGSSPTDTAALNAAFTLSAQFVNPSTGQIATSGTAAQLNTLADIVAACINTTGGTASDGSTCGNLFALTPSTAGTTPADTITALLNIAQDPTTNVAQLYNLVPAAAPFQPTATTTPPDLTLPQTPSANTGSGLQIGPPLVTFPSTSLGITAPSQTVVVSNNTIAAIALSGIAFTGADQADFAQTNTCGAALAAFTICTVSITFTPHGSSARSASLSLTSASPDSPQTVALAGNGAPMAAAGPHAVVSNSFVNIYPGASFDLTLSNTGNAPLAISSIALAGTPFNLQTNDCPSSLTAGASCTITIRSLAVGADQLTLLTNDQSLPPNILIFQTPNSPPAVFTPSNLFFASTAVGSTSTFSYIYHANATLAPALSGPQASEFTATTPVCTPGSYPETGPTCTFSVAFKPAASGLRSAKLALDTSGNYLPLAGMGTSGPPASAVSFPYLNFTYFPLPQGGLLTNNSGSAVPTSSITFQSLPGTPEFTQTNNCGSSIAPGSSCTLNVSSTRLTEGGTQALLTVNNGTDLYTKLLDNSLYQVIDFGNTTYNSAPTAQKASYPLLASPGGMGSSNLFSSFLADSPWLDFSFPGCSSSSSGCVGEVNYNPTQPGAQTGSLTVAGSSSGYSPSVNTLVKSYILVGTGAATEPAAKLILQQSGFTSIAGMYPPTPPALTLVNPGAHTLNITGPALSGPAPQNFTLGQASCSPPPGASSTYPSIAEGTLCSIPLTFPGTQTGFSAATATVTDTTSGLIFSVPLYLDTVTGPIPSPSSLTFPATGVFSVSPPQSITVTRDITHPVTTGTSGGLIAIKGSCAAGETPCILTFAFAPTVIAESPAVTISDNTFGTSTYLPVSGSADGIVVSSSGQLSTNNLYFPGQNAGTSSLSQPITLASGGPGPLDIYSITLSGANANDFAETTDCPATVPAASSCTISISFVPASVGLKSATLTLNDSANPGEPATVVIRGTAQ